MKVHAASLGVLAVSATLGLVVAQDRPAREPDPAPPGGARPRRHRSRESDVRAITDLLASFVKAYNAKDAKALGDLFTPDAEIQDEDGDVTQGRDAIVAHFAGIFKENGGDTSRRGHRLPAVPRDGSRHRGGYGVALDRGGDAAAHQPV